MKLPHILIILVIAVLLIAGGTYVFFNLQHGNQSEGEAQQVGWKTYTNEAFGFSLFYPPTFSIHEQHVYQALGPGKDIPGVSFVIPDSLARGTNLSNDTYFAVETASTTDCAPAAFLSDPRNRQTITEGGITYDLAESGEAAAGNRYEEYVYVYPNSSPCMAVRYFIHYTNIENYDPGTVIEFDKKSLLSAFDTMRQLLSITKTETATNPSE